MESLFAEFKKQSEGLARQDQELQLQIVKLEETNHQLSSENENLLRRVQTLERLKQKQGIIVTNLSNFHNAITSTVVSPTSTPVSVIPSQEEVSESLVGAAVTTNEDANWETVSTDEYIPFESSTKRPQKYIFEHLVNLTDTTETVRSSGDNHDQGEGGPKTHDVEPVEPPAQRTKLNGDDDVVQRARANKARREQVRNKCWFFQSGCCAYGDICNKSHDVLPFKYCAWFNTNGKCSVNGCKAIHELFEYKKPIISDSERLVLLRAVRLNKRN